MYIALLLCILICLLLIYHYVNKSSDRWKKLSQYPGDVPWPLLGNGLQLGFDADEASHKLMVVWEKHGKQNYRFAVGSEDWVLLSNPDDIGTMLNHPTELSKPLERHIAMKPFFGDSVASSEGERWKSFRKLMTQGFQYNTFKKRLEEINISCDRLFDILDTYDGKGPVDLYKYMRPFMYDIICGFSLEKGLSGKDHNFVIAHAHLTRYRSGSSSAETSSAVQDGVRMRRSSTSIEARHSKTASCSLMGVESNLLNNPDHPYLQASKKTIKIITYNYFSYWRNIRALFILTPMYWEMMRTITIMKLNSTYIINERRNKITQLRNGKINNVRTDFISETNEQSNGCLLDSFLLKELPNGESIPDEFINDEVTFLCFTGHYTMAVTISHTLYCLAKYPEIQKKVFEEQRSLFDNINKKPTNQNLNEMKYLEAVIKESLRVIPTVTKIGRTLHNDLKFKDGRVAPAGTSVFVFYEALYQNPMVFPEPELYKPERHLELMHAYSLVPFSAGPRNCLGFRYAMLAIKATLSNILKRYEILLGGPGTEPQFAHRIVTESKNGIQLRLRRRKSIM